MKASKTSKQWMQEHVNDPFVQKAQKDGYRSRAAYKLLEIDDKDKLLKKGDVVVDLGAAPGGWSQIASKQVGETGKVIALDLLFMDGLPNVEFIQGDFTDELIYQKLAQNLENRAVDLVISDMAPNMSGVGIVDQGRAMYLCDLALEFTENHLKPNGNFLIKVFQGQGFESYLKQLKQSFNKVVSRKPKASRDRSSEVYLLGIGKIDSNSR